MVFILKYPSQDECDMTRMQNVCSLIIRAPTFCINWHITFIAHKKSPSPKFNFH